MKEDRPCPSCSPLLSGTAAFFTDVEGSMVLWQRHR
jgi:hypothetical protein